MSLGEICDTFQNQAEALDPSDGSNAARLGQLVTKLAKDAAAEVENYVHGEVPALLQLCQRVHAWLGSEAEDPEDRQRRYGRQRAVLDLLTLCEAVRASHAGTRAQRRANVDALRGHVADALAGLVGRVEDD